jgi:hypothetical protein
LKALGFGNERAHASIRFGLGRFNTQAEVDYVADRVADVVRRLRELVLPDETRISASAGVPGESNGCGELSCRTFAASDRGFPE